MNEEEKRKAENRKWRRIFFIIVAIVVLLFLVVQSITMYQKHERKAKEKVVGEYVLQELNKEYHQEFVIKDSDYTKYMGMYEFTCYPKDNPLMIFMARTGGVGGGISDQYWTANCSKDTGAYYFQYTQKIFNNNSVNIWLIPMGDKFYQEAYQNNYSFNTMFTEYRNQCKLFGTIYYFEKITPENREAITKSLYAFYEKLYSEKYKEVNIMIYFRDPKLFDSWEAKRFAKKEGIKNPLENSDEFVKLYDAAYFETGFGGKYNNVIINLYINSEGSKYKNLESYAEFSKELIDKNQGGK